MIKIIKKIFNHTIWAIKGCIVLVRIKRDMRLRGRDRAIVLSGSIGDAVFSLAYLDVLFEDVNNKPLIVCTDANKGILEAYDIECIVRYPLQAKKYLDSFIKSTIASELGLKIGVINATPFHIRRFYNQKNNGCLYILTELYGIDANARLTFPKVDNNYTDTSIKKIMENKGNVVIINPYSNDMSSKSIIPFICEIRDYYKDRGFIVYTNLAPSQKEIDGTIPLRCSIMDLYRLCIDTHPFFISVRSGICDWLTGANIDMFVMYTSKPDKYYQMFSLAQWKSKGNIEEVYFDKQSEDDIWSEFKLWDKKVNHIKK